MLLPPHGHVFSLICPQILQLTTKGLLRLTETLCWFNINENLIVKDGLIQICDEFSVPYKHPHFEGQDSLKKKQKLDKRLGLEECWYSLNLIFKM